MRRGPPILALLFCLSLASPVSAQRIALFVPHVEQFWGLFTEFTKAAAADLGVDLSVYVAERSVERMLQQVGEAAADGVDGILFTDYQGIGESILRIAEAHRTPALLVNAGLLNNKILPRTDYRYWIGGVSPDDRQAGARLAAALIGAARRLGAAEYEILAFAGSAELPMQRRLEGLKAVVDSRSDVKLLEALPFNEGELAVREAFDEARRKHPGLNIVWSFHDDLALIASRHYAELDEGPRKIAFGGINWSPDAMAGLEAGLLDVDFGGHIFDGAQGLVMLLDYLNGSDFNEQGLLFQSAMSAAQPTDAPALRRILADPYLIDYRALSKTFNPDLPRYRFDLAEIAAQPGVALNLSREERAWIREHAEISVGGTKDWAPFDFVDEHGEYAGITRDYLDLVARNTGLHFSYRPDEWGRLLDDIREQRVDVLGSVYHTAERDRYLAYSPPYFEVLDYFFVRDDLPVSTFADLDGKRVALPRGYALEAMLREHFPNVQIVGVESLTEAIDAVLEGRADLLYEAYTVLNYVLRRQGITSIVPFKSTRQLGSNRLHLVTRQDDAVLASILRKGLEAISPGEKVEIYNRWLGSTPAERAPRLALSDEEARWLSQHPRIRVRVGGNWPPFEFVETDGEPQGLSIDVLHLLGEILGVTFDIERSTWSSSLDALKEHATDLIPNVAKTPQRDAYMAFSDLYIEPQYAVFTRKDASPMRSMADLVGKTVVVEERYRTHEVLSDGYPGIRLKVVPDTASALHELSFGNADAYIGNQGTVNWIADRQALTNIKIALAPPELGRADLRFGVRDDWPMLADLLSRAIAAVPEIEMQQIRRRWFGGEVDPAGTAVTAEERRWLDAHPVIRFAGDPNWLPYEAVDASGRYIGIVAEHLSLIEDALGIRFEFVPTANRRETVEMAKRGEVDMISESDDSDLTSALRFSQSYLQSPVVIVMRDREDHVEDIEEIQDRRIAVIRDYAYVSAIRRRYPDLDYVTVDGIQEGLTAVSTGRVDALFATLAQASYHIADLGVNNVRIVGKTPFNTRLAFGVRPELEPLVTLINRVLQSISSGQQRAILDAWGRDKFVARIDYRRIGAIVAAAAVVLAMALLWGMLLRRQKNRLRISEERFQLAMEAAAVGLWDWDARSGNVYYSPLWMSMLGYGPTELRHDFDTFCDLLHPDDREEALRNNRRMLEEPGYLYEQEFRLRTKDGGYRWILSRGHVFERDHEGKAMRALGIHSDITPRKEAELRVMHLNRGLAAANQRFAMAAKAITLGVWERLPDRRGRLVFDEHLLEIYGFPPRASISVYQWLRRVHPEDRKLLIDNLRKVMRSGGDAHMDFRAISTDGTLHYLYGAITAVPAGEGEPPQLIGVNWDITERKAAEENLKLFRAFAETASLGFVITGMDTQVVYMNRALNDMLGQGMDDHGNGTRCTDHYPEQERVRLDQVVLPAVRLHGTWSGEMAMRRCDGSVFPSHQSFFVVNDDRGRPQFIGSVIADISERKLAEEQFERLINALPVAVAIAAQDGEILLANPQAEKDFGDAASITGMNTAQFYPQPEQRDMILERVSRNGQVTGLEVQYRSPAGQVVEGLLSAIPIVFDGQPAMLGVVVNITERRRMERELARAKELAEEANHFKGQFLANMSHEIRTPMNAIVGLGHLLNRTNLTPQQQDYLGKIQVSARSLLSLIDDILDLSKIDAGQLRIERIDFDLGEVLEQIATLASTRLAEKAVEFLYDVSSAVPGRLHGDPYRLTQILTNLVGNATKFTREGEIVLRITVIEDGDPLWLHFVVEDTGIGIPSEKIDTLFSPFTQADGSTTREYGGTGLGLSICRQLTELMGGSIEASSVPGQGSRFEFRLPFGRAELTDERSLADLVNQRVLLVDDNVIARQVLGDLLLALSFRVDVAASGEAALKKLVSEQRAYDLVLLDWQMPELDGLVTARRIRAAGLAAEPRIILMTAYGREAMEDQIDMTDIDGFLIKPITPSQLLNAVARATHRGGESPSTGTAQMRHRLDSKLQGRVLLVEDNLINQQVAREILQQMGLEVGIASNGEECLAMIARERPDVVLMDIQMPDMDGYEVTARIRAMAQMRDLPVIAMTANAMAGDAERSLQAGMNGHITKPVDPLVLRDTLHSWLNAQRDAAAAHPDAIGGGSDEGASAALTADTEDGVADDPAIDFTAGLARLGGNRPFYARLLDDFAKRYRDAADELGAQNGGGEAAAVEARLHSLKGVAGNIAAGRLRAIAGMLEAFARAGDMVAVQDALPDLQRVLLETIEAAERFAATAQQARPLVGKRLDSVDLERRLTELAGLLEAGDAGALRWVDEVASWAMPEAVDPLRREVCLLIEDYDFAAAADTLARLRVELKTSTDAVD